MSASHAFVPCPGCGLARTPRFFGLDEDGRFDGIARRDMELRVHTYGGRGRISVTREPMPANMALGLLHMLRARTAQIEAELRAAGIEC